MNISKSYCSQKHQNIINILNHKQNYFCSSYKIDKTVEIQFQLYHYICDKSIIQITKNFNQIIDVLTTKYYQVIQYKLQYILKYIQPSQNIHFANNNCSHQLNKECKLMTYFSSTVTNCGPNYQKFQLNQRRSLTTKYYQVIQYKLQYILKYIQPTQNIHFANNNCSHQLNKECKSMTYFSSTLSLFLTIVGSTSAGVFVHTTPID
eukprot:TRINITY_DN4002_c0_g1_i9.p1 TRINITY_DN4002_c0_g1~~TRINITY_DN4002_c0_g1_i9.p1  ORF type:complete len:206 (+),score=-26.09 TRINITY_DN4002_c0_g1_i9:506-1123(+)